MNNMHEKLQLLLELSGDTQFPDSSELHGVVCAHALHTPTDQTQAAAELARWLDLSVADHAVIKAALEEQHQHLMAEAMDFALLLPGDDVDLAVRTNALAAWCGGFVSGVGVYEDWLPSKAKQVPQGASTAPLQQNSDALEAIADLSQIARASIEGETGSESDEQAYAEIVEYVRIAVQLVQKSLQDAIAS